MIFTTISSLIIIFFIFSIIFIILVQQWDNSLLKVFFSHESLEIWKPWHPFQFRLGFTYYVFLPPWSLIDATFECWNFAVFEMWILQRILAHFQWSCRSSIAYQKYFSSSWKFKFSFLRNVQISQYGNFRIYLSLRFYV